MNLSFYFLLVSQSNNKDITGFPKPVELDDLSKKKIWKNMNLEKFESTGILNGNH